ncbi:MAG: S8 family serine peptidase [Bacteroidota bacterium]|nr:S8 family serine peptidase [Bacteroidota bacterium]
MLEIVLDQERFAAMDWPLLITALGFLLIAIGVSSRDTGAWSMLSGMGMIVVGVVWKVIAGEGLFGVLLGLLWNVGLGFMVAAIWLGIRRLGTRARPLLILGAACLVLAAILLGVTHLWQSLWHRTDISILVELGPDDTMDEIVPVLAEFGAVWEAAFPTVNLNVNEDLAQTYLVNVSRSGAGSLIDALREDVENVDHVELNVEVALPPMAPAGMKHGTSRRILENDPYAHRQWALEAIAGHGAHALLQDRLPAHRARVAILDTGVESAHEDLAAAFSQVLTADRHGHGTHCAGLAGAVTNNGLGVASLNWEGRFIELLAFQALGEDGTGSLEQIAQAIVDAAQAGADVISMSLGSTADSPPRVLVAAVRFALNEGAIVVASAGNSDADAVNHYPSNIESVIAVAAVDSLLSKAQFSNTVGRLSRPIAAPGVDVLSSYLNGTYQTLSGTSMATPIVAGLLGVLRAMDPFLTAKEAYAILHDTGTEAQDLSTTGRVINAQAAIRAAERRVTR